MSAPREREPLADPGTPRRTWPASAQAAVGCGAGCSLLVLLEAVVLWVVIAVALGAAVSPDLTLTADLPESVRVGQAFPLRIVVINHGTRGVTLQSLVARPNFLRLVRLSNPRPVPLRGSMEVMGARMWPYAATIPAGGHWSAEFTAEARRAGTLSGGLEAQAGILPSPVSYNPLVIRAAALPRDRRR